MHPVYVVEAPSNLGLQEVFPGVAPAVDRLPAWLKQWGLYDLIVPQSVFSVPPPPYAMELDPVGVRNAEAIGRYSRQLAACITPVVRQPGFTLVLGGDCSILLGIALGLKRAGTYGLFFLDGHTDYATPERSATGGAAGMDLALVTGSGPDQLTNLDGQGPYIQARHAWSIGNRDPDVPDIAALQAASVAYVDLAALRRQGLAACAAAFLADIAAQGLDGFWIHFDVDVLAHEVMPAVDSPQPGGLTYAELAELLTPLLQSGQAVGMDITILDPSLDPTGAVTRHFVESLAPIMGVLTKP
ncbi:arginase family protein [Hymenobacter chitinivorans]|uniref:Arginase n=1 Tax=Hymenobacter chitinivorans DSM 11115 TaxID=1121954 RepID=A0A2M9BM40_9BACT|nr:arginase family protein [Hymenobacter chitinivorans]PJJ59024.1 arginase [Hymenobacter chitinivorans DSM 11115]